MKCVENFHDFDLHIVVSAMNALDHETKIGKTIIAVTHLVQFAYIVPAFGYKILDVLRLIILWGYLNFKEFGTFVLCVIGALVILIIAVWYTENEYNIKERLADMLKSPPKTAVLEL